MFIWLTDILLLLCLFQLYYVDCGSYDFIDLPTKHLPIYFRNYPKIAEQCRLDKACRYRQSLRLGTLNTDQCWGYEDGCTQENSYDRPICKTYSSNNDDAMLKSNSETFYNQADFGYIRQQLNEMMIMCEPLYPTDSVLECSKYARFCRGRNIMLNLTHLPDMDKPFRYKTDVLRLGDIGGYCTFHPDRLNAELSHMSALQSWAPELRNFAQLPTRPIEAGQCTRIIEKPTFIMKIDATSNMYHHFCDFLNLYASLHVNQSHPTAFTSDINILIWETYDYQSSFEETFKAFSHNQILDLKTFQGEVVCFKNVVLPLLPRMIFGLYYNTPLIGGCENSGLFQAFAEHVLHRLNIPLHRKNDQKIRITILTRQTKYRRILNADELINELLKNETYIVRHVNFERSMKFRNQLEITRNTDILIGMHGAGLTHLLFLPKWATLFELYNCDDPACYRDLARLRGINYLTWTKPSKVYPVDEGHHPEGGAHAKFTNYSFDVSEFIRLVNQAAENVWNNLQFQEFINRHNNNERHEEL